MNRRSLVRGVVILTALAPMLAGCGASGFKPLHATSGFGSSGASEKLAQIQIAPIPGRVGQRIRNELLFQTTGGANAVAPKYRLEVAIRQRVARTLVQSDGESSGQIYNLDASYRLIDIAEQKVVFEGKSYGRSGFERFESIYANVRARRDAENRAAATIGSEMKTRLEAFLASTA